MEANLLLVENFLITEGVSLGGTWEVSAFPVPVICLDQAEPASACLHPGGVTPDLVPLSLPGLARAGEIGQIQGENTAKSVFGLCLIESLKSVGGRGGTLPCPHFPAMRQIAGVLTGHSGTQGHTPAVLVQEQRSHP